MIKLNFFNFKTDDESSYSLLSNDWFLISKHSKLIKIDNIEFRICSVLIGIYGTTDRICYGILRSSTVVFNKNY